MGDDVPPAEGRLLVRLRRPSAEREARSQELEAYQWPDPRDRDPDRGPAPRQAKTPLRDDRQGAHDPRGDGRRVRALVLDARRGEPVHRHGRQPEVTWKRWPRRSPNGCWSSGTRADRSWDRTCRWCSSATTWAARVGRCSRRDLYRQVYKPRHRRLTDLIRKKTNAKIYFHTCGSVYDILPDIIESGMEIINPLQVSAKDMDSAKIKGEFGKDLTLLGRRRRRDDGHDAGGRPRRSGTRSSGASTTWRPAAACVFGSVHNIQPNVPPAERGRLVRGQRMTSGHTQSRSKGSRLISRSHCRGQGERSGRAE